MHNFFLEEQRDENPSPFIGDVQFQAFISFSINQIKWSKARDIFEQRENGLDLWVRGDSKIPLRMLIKHKKLMEHLSVVTSPTSIHNDVLQTGPEYFEEVKMEALRTAMQR